MWLPEHLDRFVHPRLSTVVPSIVGRGFRLCNSVRAQPILRPDYQPNGGSDEGCAGRCTSHQARRGRKLHRRGLSGGGSRWAGALADAGYGRLVHAGRAHRVALAFGRANTPLPVRRRPHLIGKGARLQVIYHGDTVMIPPNTMHWHGAAPDRLFSYLAMSENGEQGQGTTWAEHVSDSKYKMGPATARCRRLSRARRRHAAPRFRPVRASRQGWPRPRRRGSATGAGSACREPYG
jgi:hypothetical protein